MYTYFTVIGELYNITKDTLDIQTKNGCIEVYLSPELSIEYENGNIVFEKHLGKVIGLRGYITPFGLFADKLIPPKVVKRFYRLYERKNSSRNSISN